MTTSTTPDTPPQTLHSSLIGKTTAQQEALCEEDSTLLGCTGILAAKTARERQDEMDKLKLPFGNLTSRTTTTLLGIEAIKQAGLEAKPKKVIKSDGTEETAEKYAAGAIFLTSATGTASADATKKVYGVQAGNVERRPGLGSDYNTAKRYNIATKFMPSASGKYSIEIFHLPRIAGTTRMAHELTPSPYNRNAFFDTLINPESSATGKVNKLGTLSSTGNNAYTEIGSPLDLKEHLMLEDTDMMFEKWSYKLLSGKIDVTPDPDDEKEDGMFYAEVWDNYGVSKSDYMVGGVWLLTPEDGDKSMTKFAAFAQANMPLGGYNHNDGVKREWTGIATYKGLAAGFYVNDKNAVHRLLGKVELTADFGTDNAVGKMGGEITGITLNGERPSKDSLLILHENMLGDNQLTIYAPLNSTASTISGKINGVTMKGDWSGIFTGPRTVTTTTRPTGVVGTASGYSRDEKHTFAVSFGAKPEAAKK